MPLINEKREGSLENIRDYFISKILGFFVVEEGR